MHPLQFSVLIPTYNGSATIKETITSILTQDFDNFEVIIEDDASTDDTLAVIRSFNSQKIKIYPNKKNLGYPMNLERGRKHVHGDILYLMGQDDILAKNALTQTYSAFKISDQIGAVTRPYYWFDTDIHTPVRAKKQLDPIKNDVVRITDSYDRVIAVFNTLDQLSGLALRTKFIDEPFHPDVFPCHVYPFASIFKKHPVVFLKDYNLAVRIRSSQSRTVSSIYSKSPIQTWVELFESIYPEEKFKEFRGNMIANFVATNYIGLVQIKNYAKFRYLLREIFYLIKYRWQNIYNPYFWFFSLGTILIPPFFLIPLVDWYKNVVNSNRLKNINLSKI